MAYDDLRDLPDGEERAAVHRVAPATPPSGTAAGPATRRTAVRQGSCTVRPAHPAISAGAEDGQQILDVIAAEVPAASEHELIRRRTRSLQAARADGLE